MSYNYETEKHALLTEEGQKTLFSILRTCQAAFKTAGAVRAAEAWKHVSGDSWTMLAALDRLVELQEIREVTPPNSCAGQHRVFVAVDRSA